MRIEYDPEADALYIRIREARAHDTADIEDGVAADLDEDRHIVRHGDPRRENPAQPYRSVEHHDREASAEAVLALSARPA